MTTFGNYGPIPDNGDPERNYSTTNAPSYGSAEWYAQQRLQQQRQQMDQQNAGYANGQRGYATWNDTTPTPIYGTANQPNSGGAYGSAGVGWNQTGAGNAGGWGQYSGSGGSPWGNADTTEWGTPTGDWQVLGGQGGGLTSIPGTSYGIGGPAGGGGTGLTAGMFGAADDGRRDFVHDDYVNAALGRLSGVASGQNLPFDETTRTNMLSRASGMNAAAEEQQAGSMRDSAAAGGASLNDPSYAAAQRELTSRRQGANANAAQDIDMTANRENFAAQNTASNQMASLRFDQRSRTPIGMQPAPGANGGNPSAGGAGGPGAPLPPNGSTTGWNYGAGAGGYANGYNYTPTHPQPATAGASERGMSADQVANMNNRPRAPGMPRFPGDTSQMPGATAPAAGPKPRRPGTPIY